MAKAPSRLLEKLRTCKETGVLRKSLLVDYTTGSDFQILEWAGDRHLKSLMADIAMQTSRGLLDQGELSKLCNTCESNAALARVFDLAGISKLVDEGSGSTCQIGDAEKRKADLVEAVIGELHQKRAIHEIASEALDMLVAFIYSIGRPSVCDWRPDVCNEDTSPIEGSSTSSSPPRQTQTKNSVMLLNEWGQKHGKKIDFPQTQLDNKKWSVSVSVEGYPSPCGIGEDSNVKTAKMTAAEQALERVRAGVAPLLPLQALMHQNEQALEFLENS